VIGRLVSWSSLWWIFISYPIVAWLVLRFAPRKQRTWLFAAVNILGAYGACVAALITTQYTLGPLLDLMRVVAVGFAAYMVFALVQYWLLLRTHAGGEGWGAVALWFPIGVLILVKYIPPIQRSFGAPLHSVDIAHLSALFLGLSYLTFRLCHLVQEVRNEVVEMPTLAEYLSFSFFVPTLSLGPINPYSKFIGSYRNPDRELTPVNRSLLRIVVGFTKYFFLSSLLNQYTYSGLILDGHPHHKVDLVIALFSYTLYLYCNFSGFCDMVIGVSGLLGIQVMENFNVPFSARNLQEFWNRWHISLSTWLRDMMFTPLVKILVRIFGPKSTNNVIAFSIFSVFIVIGVWHGVGVNFALFGLFHGIGLATVHYYTYFLKKKLGKQRFIAYRENPYIAVVGRVMTFTYFSLSLFIFANSWDNMKQIFHVIIWKS
jgi:D-alanyl-lipoteichoic acid acyltransferase DltB (MBOAT superfamily)